MTTRLTYFVLPLLVACSDNSSSDVLGGSLTVTGTVHDFESGAQVTGAASVSTTALSPTPKASGRRASP